MNGVVREARAKQAPADARAKRVSDEASAEQVSDKGPRTAAAQQLRLDAAAAKVFMKATAEADSDLALDESGAAKLLQEYGFSSSKICQVLGACRTTSRGNERVDDAAAAQSFVEATLSSDPALELSEAKAKALLESHGFSEGRIQDITRTACLR